MKKLYLFMSEFTTNANFPLSKKGGSWVGTAWILSKIEQTLDFFICPCWDSIKTGKRPFLLPDDCHEIT
jgi:hypothetical protein